MTCNCSIINKYRSFADAQDDSLLKSYILFIFLFLLVSLHATNKIALLRSTYTLQLFAPNPNWGNYDSLNIIPAKQLLAKLPFQYDVINDQFIELDSLIIKGYQLVIVPNALAMSTNECTKIESFVNQGGTALIVGSSGIFNLNMWLTELPFTNSLGLTRNGKNIAEGLMMNINKQYSGDTTADAIFKGIFEMQHVNNEDQTENDMLMRNGFGDLSTAPLFLKTGSTAKLIGYWTDYNISTMSSDPRGENNKAWALTYNHYGNGHIYFYNGNLFSAYKFGLEFPSSTYSHSNIRRNAEKLVFNIIRRYTNNPKTNLEMAAWWLQNQQNIMHGLIDSYEDGTKFYDEDLVIAYDQALFILAQCALAKNDIANVNTYKLKAKKTIDSLLKWQHPEGALPTVWLMNDMKYISANDAHYCGVNAWILMALNRYIQQFDDEVTYKTQAKQIADWLITQIDTIEPGYLALRGGIAIDGTPIIWHSTEHNLDAYTALMNFGHLSNVEYYQLIALQIRKYLEKYEWNTLDNRFDRGLNDNAQIMDVNPWAILALGDVSLTGTDLKQGLNWSLENTRNSQNWNGTWDYYNNTLGTIDGFDFDTNKDVIWTEGTESMALALHVVGQDSLANYFHQQLSKLFKASFDGGLPYSSNEGTVAPGETELSNTYPSVAGTAWYIFKELNYNPFETWFDSTLTNTSTINFNKRGFTIYPNPASQSLVVSMQLFENTNSEIQIMNALGQIIFTSDYRLTTNDSFSIDISQLKTGLYFIKLDKFVQKLIIK